MSYDFNIEKIVLACYVPSGSGLTTHRDRPSHGLAIHTGGIKQYVFSDNKKITVNQNDIIYLPKYSNYTVSAISNGDCYAINFDISEDVNFEPFAVKAKNHGAITERFRLAKNIWQMKKSGYAMKCKAELYNIIYSMQQEYFSGYVQKNKLEIIKPAVEYIHKNYAKELISIAGLSKMCGITPEYLRKIFKSFYGTAPLSYINNLKISRAKELLESGMYSVSEAAEMSGYSDISHFSREFKKATGVCPSEYI